MFTRLAPFYVVVSLDELAGGLIEGPRNQLEFMQAAVEGGKGKYICALRTCQVQPLPRTND